VGSKTHVPRVFVDTPLQVGSQLEPDADKRHHLAVVLRLGAGAPLVLFNGDGHEYTARIEHASRKAMTLVIDAARQPQRESPLDLTLIQAIARGDRMDFALAKAVELGVNRIRPVFTERGQVKLAGERLARKHAHWQKVVQSAAEQSGRLVCPLVAPACQLAELLHDTENADDTQRLMLAPTARHGLTGCEPASRVALLVGPESGLSEREIETAAAQGWSAVTLGPRVLRTETAGMAALAALQTVWGDLAN